MSSSALSSLDALRTLSGSSNPLIVQARHACFKSLGDEHLHEILKICLDQHASRAALEGAIAALLDTAANEAKVGSHASSSSAAPAIPVGERTSIKRKRSETDEQRRESVLSFRSRTSTQRHGRGHGQVFDLGSSGDIDDGLRDVMQSVNETPVPKVEQPIAQVAQPVPNVEEPIAQVEQPTRTPAQPIPQIEKLLCIPDKHGKSTYKPLNTLHSAFPTDLQARLDTDFLDTEGHKIEWRRMLDNPERSMSRGRCVNNVVFSKSGKDMTWAAADGNKDRACDHCVNKKRVCAKLVEMADGVKMAVYPLPAGLRKDVEWNEMGFWVQS